MKYRSLIYILFFTLTLPGFASQAIELEYDSPWKQENPLLDRVGKPFAEYHNIYKEVTSRLLHGNSSSRAELVRLFNEAANADKSGEWDLLAGIVENTVRFYESRDGGYTWSSQYTAEDYSEKMLSLAELAKKKGFPLIRVWCLYWAAEGYSVFVQNYERTFSCYIEAIGELETITTKEFPPRPHIYNQLAGLYYTFREYGDAIIYYRKIVEDPDIKDNYYNSHYLAMNGLGLCYRNGYEDYERSSSYFEQILEQTKSNELNRKVWAGIAEGNIGYNHYLNGDLDTALLWLIPAIGKITRPNDFSFVSQLAINVANIYLKKGNPIQAKKYIDIALDYHNRTGVLEKSSFLYDVLSRYYTFTGNKHAATEYLDSTLTVAKQENDAFSGLVLRRVEQQLRATDSKLHEQELTTEQTKSRMYKQTAYLIGAALITILILLGFILLLYQHKRNAYRELVRRNQDWAGVIVPEEEKAEILPEENRPDKSEESEMPEDKKSMISEKAITPEESDRVIMKCIEEMMSGKKLYKRADLSLNVLASEINLNRYYISTALNRCTGRNFNTYVNEYRIKEAIRVMSEPENGNLTLDAIAYEAGFNDRQNFHRVFKKNTGLSPGDFRKNMNQK